MVVVLGFSISAESRYLQADPIGVRGGLNRFVYAGSSPLLAIDPLGLDFVVVTGGRRDSYNPFGHTGLGVTGAGMYSYGNDTALGSSPTGYVLEQSKFRDQSVTIIPRTSQQDADALGNLSGNTCRNCVGYFNNCAVRTDSALRAGGVRTSGWPFPGGVARDAMGAPGAETYYLPKNVPVPIDLIEKLRQFNPPNVP